MDNMEITVGIDDCLTMLKKSGWKRMTEEDEPIFEKLSEDGQYILKRRFDISGSTPKLLTDYKKQKIISPTPPPSILKDVVKSLDQIKNGKEEDNLRILKFDRAELLEVLKSLHNNESDITEDFNILEEYGFLKN